MNAERLLTHFHRLAEAPDAIRRLRRFILDLALRGELVEDSAHTDSQTVNGSSVPGNWAVKSVADVTSSIQPGFACAKTHQMEDGHVHLRTHNVSAEGRLNCDLLIRVDPKKIDQDKTGLKQGDVIFNNTNSQELVGKTCLVDRDYPYAFSNHLTRIRVKTEVDPSFLVLYFTLLLKSSFFSGLCNRWIGQAGINTKTLRGVMIPVPPLAQQHRIVSKVDELMALCNRLEAAQAERESRRDRLAAASLHRLNQPGDGEAFREQVGFHLRHLPRLATRQEHVPKLRQTILNLAVHGKLVSQDPEEEAASTNLAAIDDERRCLWQEAELAKFAASQKHLTNDNWKNNYRVPDVLADEPPFDIPSSWKWVPFARIIAHYQYGPRFGNDEYVDDGIPTVRTTDMTFRGLVSLANAPRVRIPQESEAHWRLKHQDLLVTRTGATIGKIALYEDSWGPAIASAYLIRFRLTVRTVLPRFVFLYLTSPFGRSQLLSGSTAMAQPNVNATSICAFPFPLPPRAEQHRIVAKVEELLALCDQLEAQLTTAQTESRRLLEAVLHEALTAPPVGVNSPT